MEEAADQIIGRSAIMQEMCKALGRVAPQDVNVLILGESGTGKELVARALYQHSRRSDRPFLAINCAAIPEALLESELFGHEQGAFTGASRRRIGKFEQCSGGTLFLDEIGDMPPPLQAKILRVLQEQRFERVGGNETINRTCATWPRPIRTCRQLVSEGRFRKDLYYRLNVVSLKVPQLRERLQDVAELANYFLFRFDRELGMDLRGIAPEALDRLQAHDWPGNVRELQGVVKQAMLNSSGHLIVPEFLPEQLLGVRSAASEVHDAEDDADELNLPELIEGLLPRANGRLYEDVSAAVDRHLFTRVLRHTNGQHPQASELLGINRATLRHKLKTLGLAIGRPGIKDAD